MDMIKRQSYAKYRRTKIFCTIGPACWEVPQLESMIDAGMDVGEFYFLDLFFTLPLVSYLTKQAGIRFFSK